MPVQEQVVSLYAGTQGFLDNIAVVDVAAFEDGLLELARTGHAGMMADIVSSGTVDEDALRSMIQGYTDSFQGSGGSGGIDVDPEAQPDAATSVVDADNTLPEEDISRPEDDA
jgi:hypothetical protein